MSNRKKREALPRDLEIRGAEIFGKHLSPEKQRALLIVTLTACALPMILGVRMWDRIPEIVETGLIGPGGQNIKAIQAESGADINIEEDGTVHIYAAKQEGLDRALELVTRMFKTIEIGELYTGKIVSTTTFGAFMEVLPGKDGLIHISELAEGRTAKTEDVVSV